MFKLNEAIQKYDSSKIVLSLIELRKISKSSEIDKNTFELLVNLIKTPNTKIIHYTLSILANCCLINTYRIMFKENGGIPHLVLILKTIDNDTIVCRACRLIGNLAINIDLARELCENNAGLNLLNLIGKNNNVSSGTMAMAFRALKKLWTVADFKWKMLPEDSSLIFDKSLSSSDEQMIQFSLETLLLFTHIKSIERNGKIKISKELFFKLVELSKNENFNNLTISCLSNLICYQTSHVWSFLEGSNIAQVFIEYIQRVDNIDGSVLRAFQKLCTEGAIRQRVRMAGVFERLIDLCNSSTVKKILAIFYLFQYDVTSMTMCSQNHKFTNILIENITMPGSIQLLGVLSRLSVPPKELVLEKNLDVIINNKECNGILKNIIKTRQFLKPLLLSGKVWEIDKAGYSLEDLGCLGSTEGLVIELFNSGDKKCKKDVSLAIPFLVKPRNFELLYKLLAHYQVITYVLQLLKENPTEEKVLASIIRLINIFKYNYHKADNFFQEFVKPDLSSPLIDSYNEIEAMEIVEEDINSAVLKDNNLDSETVIFEFDDGTFAEVNKTILCKNSPVLDSMLNGHFMEANQDKVRLRNCSKESFLYLVKLLKEEVNLGEIELKIYLELLSVTDKYLLTKLNTTLTNHLVINESSGPLAYEWYRKAGYTRNNSIVRQKIYEFLFSSSENLLLAMKHEACRIPLINEIFDYLSNSMLDLL